MPHLRQRFAQQKLEKYLKFWPVVGIIGLRQCGKTTLVGKLLRCGPGVSFDDLENRKEARSSPKTFLARLERPAVIDEAQKAPEIFDAIKLQVDRQRIPGEFVLTGSSSFSARIGIQESLTGRIGTFQLRPFTQAELTKTEMPTLKSLVLGIDSVRPRFSSADISKTMQVGGMPGVAFIRDGEHRRMYWSSWLETVVTRDLPRLFKRGYDPDTALAILERMGTVLSEGELPALHHFPQPARVLKNYLDGLCQIFVVDRVSIHPAGVGKDVWLFGDGGLAGFLMRKTDGIEAQRSLVRHFLHNEWMFHKSMGDDLKVFGYYKTAQGTPIDAVIDGVPILITSDANAVSSRLSWVERPLRGAMKKLGARLGVIAAPIDKVIPAKANGGIAVVPWSAWS